MSTLDCVIELETRKMCSVPNFLFASLRWKCYFTCHTGALRVTAAVNSTSDERTSEDWFCFSWQLMVGLCLCPHGCLPEHVTEVIPSVTETAVLTYQSFLIFKTDPLLKLSHQGGTCP